MRSVHARRQLAVLLMSVLGVGAASASLAATPARGASQSPVTSQPSQQFVDGIAAVVNKQVITLKQVNIGVSEAEANLKAQNIPVPSREIMQRQVLQRMIMEELQRQEANRLGIRVSDAQLQRGVETVAQRNGMTENQLRETLLKSGVEWSTYLEGLRDEIRFDLLRQRQVDSTINISDSEVNAFLRTQGVNLAAPAAQASPMQTQPQAAPRALGLAQILVAVPEGAAAAEVARLQDRAEALRAQLQAGADFSGLAAASSDGPQALEGGVMGVRPIEGWPDLFLEAARGLRVGEVSRVVRSGQGFHILKVLTWGQEPAAAARAPAADFSMSGQQGGSQGPMIVSQTRARHILVRINQITSDEQAEQRLRLLRDRLRNGESFEQLARRHSDDATAPQGGDLGWLSPGETVPAFEQAMNTLQPGEISEPIRSPFGWHLIEVLERRNQDMGAEFQRMQARQLLFQRRIEPAIDQWLSELWGQAYIENRLDPESSRGSQRR